MRHRLLKGVGYTLVVLLFAGVALSTVLALLNGKPNLWTNPYGVPVGTYSTVALFGIIGVVYLVLALRRILQAVKCKAPDQVPSPPEKA